MKTLNLFLIFFFLFSINTYSLPKCKGEAWRWNDCNGTSFPKKYEKYKGEWKDGKPHGKGIYVWELWNAKYKGEWKDGKRHGTGVYVWNNDNYDKGKYNGDWKNDMKDGYGDLKATNKYGEFSYSGYWKDGKRHGKGTWTNKNIKRIATWKNGKLHGMAKIISKCSERIQEYKEGGLSGSLTIDSDCGRERWKFEGKGNSFFGKGTLTYSNGNIYVGEVLFVVPNRKFTRPPARNGKGELISLDGYKYIGEYKVDLRHGKGVSIYPNGDKYEGTFKDNKYNGKGTYTDANGKVTTGRYEDGKYVGRYVDHGY